MMLTLLKHEWLRTRGPIGVVVAIAALAVVLAAVLTALGIPVVSSVAQIAAIAAALLLGPVLQLLLAADFWSSGFRRTGYFTQTLPVKGSTIFSAKFLWAVLVVLGGYVVSLLLAAVIVTGMGARAGQFLNPLQVARETWGAITAMASPALIVAGAFFFLVMSLLWTALYYVSISLGNQSPLNRLGFGGPIVVFLAAYVVMQALMTGGVFTIPYAVDLGSGQLELVANNIAAEMASTSGPDEDMMPIGFLVPAVPIIMVSIGLSARSWGKKISLA